MRQYIRNTAAGLLIMLGFSVALLTLLANFILPEKFAATARISTGEDPAAGESMMTKLRSDIVLSQVITNLNLNKKWAEQRKAETDLRTEQALALLRPRVTIGKSRNAALIEITVLSEDRAEAASIANEIVKVGKGVREDPPKLQVVEPAMSALKPARPRKGRNITLGFLVGLGLGGLGAALLRDRPKMV